MSDLSLPLCKWRQGRGLKEVQSEMMNPFDAVLLCFIHAHIHPGEV